MGRMVRTGLIGHRYRLIERLGAGGMSVVWRGYDEVLGRQVAVKVLSVELAADERFRERLRQEALAAARLCHPNITGIFDFGETGLGDGPAVPYVVMELIDGEPVSARLRRQGPMAWRDAVVMTAEVASALAVAHSRGVVHRDITPANVMLTAAGAKVVDFGISALVGQRDAGPDGSLLGTPAYLAPERLAGGAVSPATDVYALGVLFYRSLTGRLPWPAENTQEALRAHLYADPEPLPGLPAPVAELCFRCLAKDPAVRPAAGDLARALGDLCGRPSPLPPESAVAVSHAAVSRAGASLAAAFLAGASYAGASYAGASSATGSFAGASSAGASLAGAHPAGASNAGASRASASRAGACDAGASRGAASCPTVTSPLPSFAGPARTVAPAGSSAGFGAPDASGADRPARASAAAGPTRTASGRIRRLRTALRLGSRLHLGDVRALGGGVFVGGRLARDLITGRALFAGRHRLQAGVGTLALLAVAGLIWAGSRTPADVISAQAAAGPGPAVVLHAADCRVTYRVWRDSGRDFDARLTLRNDSRRVLRGWRLEFAYPGNQRLTARPRRVRQDGRQVIVRGDADGGLAAGRSLTVRLRGAYRRENPLPQAFTLNGQTCDTTLLGATNDPADDPAPVEAAGAAEPEK